MDIKDALPRGPLYRQEENEIDTPDHYKEKMIKYHECIKAEALRSLMDNPETKNIPTYVNYLEGKHWGKERPRYRSTFINNKIQQARKDRLALLTDSKPNISVTTDIDLLKPVAAIIDNVLRKEWVSQDMDLSLVSVADNAMLWGTGYWKIGSAAPGYTRVIPCSPDSVMPIQPGQHIQDSLAIGSISYKNPLWVKRVHPFSSHGIDKYVVNNNQSTNTYNRPDSYTHYNWSALNPGLRRVLGEQNDPRTDTNYKFNSVELEEYYIDDDSINDSKKTVIVKHPYLSLEEHNWWYAVKPGEKLYPRKRLLVFCGNIILYDGPSPFWHGLYPYACLRFNQMPQNFYGYSLYRDLLPLQKAIDNIGAGLMDQIFKAINPTVISKSGAVDPNAWKQFLHDQPGAKLQVNHISDPATAVNYVKQPEIPAYVMDFLYRYCGPEFDKLAGLIDIASVSRKNQMPSGDTIEQMKDSLQTSLRLDMRYLETFLKDVGQIAVSNVIQFYTAKQRMKMLGEDGVTIYDLSGNSNTMIPEGSNKETFWKNFSFSVEPGSLHSSAADKKKVELMALAKMGLVSRRYLLRKLDFDNGEIEQIMNELAEETKALAMMDEQGRTPRVNGEKNGMA